MLRLGHITRDFFFLINLLADTKTTAACAVAACSSFIVVCLYRNVKHLHRTATKASLGGSPRCGAAPDPERALVEERGRLCCCCCQPLHGLSSREGQSLLMGKNNVVFCIHQSKEAGNRNQTFSTIYLNI